MKIMMKMNCVFNKNKEVFEDKEEISESDILEENKDEDPSL